MKIQLKVTTATKEIDFECDSGTRARNLFQEICKNINIRETWYFGLYYSSPEGEKIWIDESKKRMEVYKASAKKLQFNIKYYPEAVTHDLIENVTIKYFFLEMRNEILKDAVYCPPGTCFLLASYAAQAKHGDYSRDIDISNSKLLPDRVYKQHNMDDKNFLENVINLWKNLRGLIREDAMIEYLKLTQNLEMFGVHYFKIKNPKGTDLLLGVYAYGLNIYSFDDKLNAKINFPWSEIANLTFKGKKFIIKCKDKNATTTVFFTDDPKTNKRILNLGVGYHQLYIKRRKSDGLEIIEMREHAENQRKMLRNQREQLQDEVRTRENLEKRYKEDIRKLQEEMDVVQKKFLESQEMIARLNKQLAENEAARRDLERRQRDLQEMMERLQEVKSMEAAERQKLEDEIALKQLEIQKVQREVSAKDEETLRLQEQVELSRREQEELRAAQAAEAAKREEARLRALEAEVPALAQTNEQLNKQLAHLQKQLEEARNVSLDTAEDKIHRENLREGRDKYKTLNEIRKGNTTRRVDMFENF